MEWSHNKMNILFAQLLETGGGGAFINDFTKILNPPPPPPSPYVTPKWRFYNFIPSVTKGSTPFPLLAWHQQLVQYFRVWWLCPYRIGLGVGVHSECVRVGKSYEGRRRSRSRRGRKIERKKEKCAARHIFKWQNLCSGQAVAPKLINYNTIPGSIVQAAHHLRTIPI